MTLTAVVGLAAPATASPLPVTIDLSGLEEGEIISSLAHGDGVSGTPTAGSIDVSGAPQPAVVFDATCDGDPATCTGGDSDLYAPEHGNVMIVAEDAGDEDDDGRVDDPDDRSRGGTIDLDLSEFGPGTFDAVDMTVIDTEEGGAVELYRDGQHVDSASIPSTANGEQATVVLGTADIDALRIVLDGSGAVDDIRLDRDPECSDGVDNRDSEDTHADTDDPGCHTDGDPDNPDSYDPDDDDETDDQGPAPACSDGTDNDGDGSTDADDPSCHTDGDPGNPDSYDPNDDDESSQCNDGTDNDGDGVADTDDPGCHTDGDPGNPDSYDPDDDDERDGTWSCRASAIRVGTGEPFVANPDGEPCLAEDASFIGQDTVGPVTGSIFTAITELGGLTGPAAATGGVAEVVIDTATPITAEMVSARATGSCADDTVVLEGESQVVGLTVGGSHLDTSGPITLHIAGVGTLYVNQQVLTAGATQLIQRALFLDLADPSAPDIVVGEAIADYHGQPCAM